MEKYSIKEDVTLRDHTGLDPDNWERTSWMYVTNWTPFIVEICFFQVTCRYGLGDPYINDTGVFVGEFDGNPGGDVHADPWEAGGVHRPIAGTSASCSLKITDGTNSKTFNFDPYPEAEEGSYYPTFGWEISVGARAAAEDNLLDADVMLKRRVVGFRGIAHR
ncbi:hypothetical protein [Oceaniradius stylonematis]|uniref:hypothetical protein n=1 Tax=Oceaniradius stylonematis TaxID=2184161 RepID=UPI00273F0C1F|nr:hypothetical protein [Oceaniradius stylonematis]